MRFTLLGAVTIDGPAGVVPVRGAQPALLLARLVLDRPRPLRREDLAEMLWDDVPLGWPAVARKVVSRARDALAGAGAAEGALRSTHGVLQLDLDGPIAVDVEEAAAAVDTAEAALPDDPAKAAALAEAALAALDGSFLAESDAAWVVGWRARLAGLAQRASHVAVDASLALGLPGRASDLGHAALLRDPLDERATRLLMRALTALDHTAGAIAVYERLRRSLDEQLGVRPSAETEAAYREVLGAPPIASEAVASTGERGPAGVWWDPDGGGARTTFVGRQRELAALAAARRGAAGGARIVVLEGEPGIGKTRLALEGAAAARADGATVLWSQCDPAPEPHAVFTDLLRQLLALEPELPARLGPVAGFLVSLVPELGRPADGAPPSSDDRARSRLASALTAAFTACAGHHLVVVVDDLHRADGDTLALIERVLPVLADQPLLFVMTTRHRSGDVGRVLAEVGRTLPVDHLEVGGLGAPALSSLLRDSGVRLPQDRRTVAALLAARTGGNPLYATQLLVEARHAGRPFDPRALPTVVAQLAERRLASLDADARGVLVVAAVIGSPFDLAVLEACSALQPVRVLEVVEELCHLHLLAEREPETFAFVHDVIREAVLASVTATRRQRIHKRVAEALVGTAADAGTIAHHLAASGPGATSEAVGALLVAGDDALRRAAWAAAEARFADAERLAADLDDRADALVGLGRARRALGDITGARTALEEARALAEATGRARALAAATLALVGGGGRGVALDLADADRARLLRQVVDELGAGDGGDADLLVPALAELSLALVLTDAAAERAALCDRALEVARRSGDDELQARALLARRTVSMGPAGTEARLADGHEALALSPRALPPESSIAVDLGLVEDLLELGHRDAAEQALRRADERARALDHPYWRWATTCWRALGAVIDGRLDDAEQLAGEALGFPAAGEHPEALAAFGVHLVDIRLFQGRAPEVLDLLEDAADANPHIPAYRAVLALCAVEAGDDRGPAAYERLAAGGFALPHDSNWLLGTAVLADACATLGDATGAAVLFDALVPWAERQVVLNCYGGGGAYWGPVTHHLGRLAATLGRPAAPGLLADAAARAERFGAPGFAARSATALAATAPS